MRRYVPHCLVVTAFIGFLVPAGHAWQAEPPKQNLEVRDILGLDVELALRPSRGLKALAPNRLLMIGEDGLLRTVEGEPTTCVTIDGRGVPCLVGSGSDAAASTAAGGVAAGAAQNSALASGKASGTLKRDVSAAGPQQAIASRAQASTQVSATVPTIACTDTGTVSRLVCSAPNVTAYTAGMTVYVIPAAGNTGASTINVNGLGVVALTKNGSASLSGGELLVGAVAQLQYDGTRFQLLNVPASTSSAGAIWSDDGTTVRPPTGRNVAIGTASPRQIGTAYFYADQFAGADPSIKINNCVATVIAAAGGTCDSRSLGGTASQAVSQQINVGSSTSAASHITVVLVLPTTAHWVWSLTDGTSCGIMQFSDTALIGDGPGGGGNRMILDADSGSTSMDSLYCTDPTPASGGSYIRAEGFLVQNTGGAAFANGIIHIRRLFDQSSFRRIGGVNPSGDAWHIDYACCGDAFDNIQGFVSTNGTGGYPLVITGGTTFYISNSTFNGPGAGKNNIYIAGAANATTNVLFTNTYMEKYTSDFSTAMVYVGQYPNNISFVGGNASTSCGSPGCSQVIFETHTMAGFSVRDFGVDYHTTNGVNDVANGRRWPTDGNTIHLYSTGTTGSRAFVQGIVGTPSSAPGWLRSLGDGSEGAYSCSGMCTLNDEHWYSSVSVSAGAMVAISSNGDPLIIRSTGDCTIAGTISVSPNTDVGGAGFTSTANGGGTGGGGGLLSGTSSSANAYHAGAGGGSSGAAGSNGTSFPAAVSKMFYSSGLPYLTTGTGVMAIGGTGGGSGGSSGGVAGKGAQLLVLVCNSINFTGTLDASGGNGGKASGNNTGGGGGGGGGVVLMSAITYSANSGTVDVRGGTGGACGAFTGCGVGGSGGIGNFYTFTIQ